MATQMTWQSEHHHHPVKGKFASSSEKQNESTHLYGTSGRSLRRLRASERPGSGHSAGGSLRPPTISSRSNGALPPSNTRPRTSAVLILTRMGLILELAQGGSTITTTIITTAVTAAVTAAAAAAVTAATTAAAAATTTIAAALVTTAAAASTAAAARLIWGGPRVA